MTDPWLTVSLSGHPTRPLAVTFRYHEPTLNTWRAEFCGEGGAARWNPDAKCWLLKRTMMDALIAGYGDRLSLDYDALCVAYPAKVRRPRPAKQMEIWR